MSAQPTKQQLQAAKLNRVEQGPTTAQSLHAVDMNQMLAMTPNKLAPEPMITGHNTVNAARLADIWGQKLPSQVDMSPPLRPKTTQTGNSLDLKALATAFGEQANYAVLGNPNEHVLAGVNDQTKALMYGTGNIHSEMQAKKLAEARRNLGTMRSQENKIIGVEAQTINGSTEVQKVRAQIQDPKVANHISPHTNVKRALEVLPPLEMGKILLSWGKRNLAHEAIKIQQSREQSRELVQPIAKESRGDLFGRKRNVIKQSALSEMAPGVANSGAGQG